nr:phospholipase-like protein [Tanacetum cinerariifolium]
MQHLNNLHPDVDVNISVACCICDVLTIMTPYNHEQTKEFFQLVVVTFEKLTSTRGGCYTKMMKVLETLSSVQFMELMSECLHLDGLIVRLFKQFISVADSNSSAVVSKMEQIMTMIMGEREKVLKNCAARLSKPHRADMSVRDCENSQSEKKMENAREMTKMGIRQGYSFQFGQVGVAVPGKVSSSQSDIICVQGYKVKNFNAPILRAIFRSHGDIAANCVFTYAAVRTSLLEAVCEIAGQIKSNDVTNIISEMEEIESEVSAAEASKINVSWLQAHLETIRKRNEAQKKVNLLMEMKTSTILAKKAASTDLKDKYDNLVAAMNQYKEAKRCVKVLDLVEKKLSNDILESKAEKELLVGRPILYVD